MVTSGQPTHEPSIYLRPKRNSRIYFTYALLPSYFQLYEHAVPEEITVGACKCVYSLFTKVYAD